VTIGKLACVPVRQPETDPERLVGSEAALERRGMAREIREHGPPAVRRMDVRAVGQMQAAIPRDAHEAA
jgi:hypothetical protein